ncbi:MAG: hypothetical protein NTV56_18940 [Alphaproteobacteria bacterium]|nr:hypothetical protein [Alphaproteobacteria bacterium]
MNSVAVPDLLPMSLENVCSISLECWRLERLGDRLKDTDEGVGIRHASRHIAEILRAIGVELVDFTGRNYDPGLVPEVVEMLEEAESSGGHLVIAETISPTMTLFGQVVKRGQIIVKRSAGSSRSILRGPNDGRD